MEQIHQVEKFLNNKIMFDFLKKYIIPNGKESENKEYEHLKHHFFPLSNNEINLVNRETEIPLELKIFYTDIGYGFFFKKIKIILIDF